MKNVKWGKYKPYKIRNLLYSTNLYIKEKDTVGGKIGSKGGPMKNKYCLLLVILAFKIGTTQSVSLPWIWLNPLPSDNGLSDCYAIDSNTLFIVDYEQALVYKTTDGGLTWTTKWVPYPDSVSNYYRFLGIDFPTPNVGYIGGVSNSTAIILKTTDQGENWNYVLLGVSGGLYDIDFPQGNPDVGYAVGTQSIILKTTNGGANWVAQTNPGATYQILRAVHFPVNADTGYAVGGLNTYDTLYPLILKTTDGGQNWIQQTSPILGGYHGVHFCNNNIGYACGSIEGYYGVNPKGVIIKTTNGGNNWQLIYYNPNEYVKGIYFLTASLGFAFIVKAGGSTYSSLIRKTTNGGSSWDSIIPPQRCAVHYKFSFSFANQNIGYSVGSDYDINFSPGRIFKTTNCGASWFSLKKGPDVTLWAVDFPENDQIGYAVGDSGYILKTSDGGLNWVRQFTGTAQRFRDVHFVNNLTGFAVGENGVLFKTTNGGNTWIPKNSTTTMRLNAVKFVNEQIGYIGGGGFWPFYDTGAVILKTTNGGDTWANQNIQYNTPIQDLFFFNGDTGYAVAGPSPEGAPTAAIIYKTTNGGQNWVVNYVPPQQQGKVFYAIDFPVNSQVGFVGGVIENQQFYKVKILKTTNSGSSWQQIIMEVSGDNSTSAIGTLSFRDNFVGYAAPVRSEYSNIYKTTDGGLTWRRHIVPTRHVIYDICAIKNTDITYAVGPRGMILKTTNGGSVWIEEKNDDEKSVAKNENEIVKVYPNPFRNNVHIRCRMHDTGYMIKIYDISGRVVKSFNLESCIMYHESSITWFGNDELGRELPAGVYFIVLEDKSVASVRVVKIR